MNKKIILKIKEKFKDKKNIKLGNFLKENIDVKKELENYLINHQEYEKPSFIIIVLMKNLTFRNCETCGKKLTYSNCFIYNRKFCSNVCKGKSTKVKQKRKLTTLKKYGVENVSQTKEVQSKVKQTNQKKYGVDYSFQSEIVKDKIKETCFQRYGVEHHLKNKNILEKQKQTNLQKYGYDYILSSSNGKKNLENCMLEKYGVNNCSSSIIIKDKKKTTSMKNFNCENPMQDSTIQMKNKQSKSKTTYKKFNRWDKYIVPMFTIEEYNDYSDSYKWKCVKCGNEFEQQIITNVSIRGFSKIPRCYHCYPVKTGKSNLEKEVVNFLKPYFPNLIENNRKLIKPSELDMIIPSKKIAIEFNGLYWHSDIYKENNYHLMKTQRCEEQGYQLIHIFEDEWLNKQEIVKSRLKAILGLNDEKVYARKCVIKELDSKTKNKFLEKYHLQGQDRSKVKLGLFYEKELIGVMTFGKPRFNKNYKWELIRFASKLQIVGGASKLLKYFERNYNPKNIVSYADRRYSKGNVYKKLGFNFLRNSESNYCWIKGYNKLPRYQCQKHKLEKLLGRENFDINLSENENMLLNGFNKIYDCGNVVFIKEF